MYQAMGTKALMVLLIGVLLVAPVAAQPAPDDDSAELIVLLAPGPEAPAPESVVGAINEGATVPGGLGVGNPSHAELVSPTRARGRVLERILGNPDSAEARLQRYILLEYSPYVSLENIATELSANPYVEHVEENHEVQFHVTPFPAKTTIPSDPLVGTGESFPDSNQWALHLLNLPEAWTWHTGHGFVAALDMGLQVTHEDLITYGSDSTGNPTLGPYRQHISRDIAYANCGVDELEERPNPDPAVNRAGHGTQITGIIGARADNGFGVAGTCWDCSIQMMKISPAKVAFVVGALEWVMAEGAQAVNMSFRMLEEACTPQSKRLICNTIEKATNRDILLVAAAGNDLGDLDFPANDSRVVGVGGLEWISTQSGEPIAQFWSEEPNCPFPNDPVNPKSQCGSNFGPELDFVAPAKTIISTMYEGFDHNPTVSCGDNFLASPGYGPCTGTSMSTPFLVGIAALVRSVNPLLSRDDVYVIIMSTASQADNHTDELGYGFPDAEAAVKKALGIVNGETLTNRLTPFFGFFGRSSDPSNPANLTAETWFYTTVPAVASGLLISSFDPFVTAGPHEVSDYRAFPTFQPCDAPCDTVPKASIFVFTTARAPFAGAPELVPLYRLRYDPDIFKDCDRNVEEVPQRDFSYATSVAEVLNFNAAGYYLDGIEGFIFRSCEGQPGCAQPPGTVKVYRAYNSARIDYAIFPEDELPGMQADGYLANATVIGYAYPNVDTDGDTLIDGFEELIGTNPRLSDTDCDGLGDGAEVAVYNQAQQQYGDALDGPCWIPGITIFADGFESGDIARW